MHTRNAWVDNAKGIGIILVVYGHVARGVASASHSVNLELFKLVDSIIYSFHMPLFFFLAGLFFHATLHKRGKMGLVLNKVDTILYPYVLWSLIQGTVEVALSHYTNGNTTIGDVLSLIWHPRAQFWFLYALFLVFTLCTLIYAHVRQSYFLPMAMLFALCYLAERLFPHSTILNYMLNNTVFFALGIWFKEVVVFFEDRRAWLTTIFGVLFLGGQYLFHITFGLRYTDEGMPSLLLAVISIFFVVMLAMCLNLEKIKWLQLLGASSMTIYLMHILVGSGTRVILQKVFGIESIEAYLLLGTTLGLVLPLLAQIAIRRCNWKVLLVPPDWMSASHTCQRAETNG